MKFLETAEKLKKAKSMCAEGKRIDPLKIEPEVSPMVLLGYDEATRINSRFLSLIIPRV